MNDFLQLTKQVVLKPYVPRPSILIVYATDQEIWHNVGNTLIFDSEVYRNFFLLQFLDIKTRKIIRFQKDKTFNAQKLSWIMHSYRTVGFNSIKYDLPILWYAYLHSTTTEQIKRLSDAIIIHDVWPKQLEKDCGFTIFPTEHIDLIEVCPLRGSLKLYGGRLHAKRIQDLPFDPNVALLDDKQFDIVVDYNISDLLATEVLFNNLTEQLQLRTDLSREYNQNVMSKSDAQIAETVIGSELKRLTGKWPSKPKIDGSVFFNYKPPAFIKFQTQVLQDVLRKVCETEYSLLESGRLDKSEVENLKIQIGANVYRLGSGGLHSSEKQMTLKADHEHKLFDRDVASYYPAIVLNCKLFPNHLGEPFLRVYQTIVDRRIAAKKAKNIAISECLKICINGTFGKTGSPFSFLYAPEMMIQITVTGQLALLMLIERMELSNIPVASANTDGILIYCPVEKEAEYRSIIAMWEQITGFVTEETEYDAIYSRDVNAYIAIKKSKDCKPPEVKGKNLYYDPWRGKTARDGYWRFQKNPSTQICIEAIEQFIINQIPIERTIRECTDITKFVAVKNVTGGAHKDSEYLGKVIRWYYARNIIGTINYITSGNKVPDTEGAKPCMDLPDAFPSDIDYEWYCKKCIDILYDIGYLRRQEQIKLF